MFSVFWKKKWNLYLFENKSFPLIYTLYIIVMIFECFFVFLLLFFFFFFSKILDESDKG